MTSPDRHVALDGVHNFRDLGGYAARDGRTTKWRTMYRADGLGQLTDADVERLRPLDLRTVVDLRTQQEMDERGRFPVEAHPIAFHHVSLIDTTWDIEEARRQALPAADFLHQAYSTMLADSGERFAGAITILADADAVPAVFHCAAGKDRTGLLAALVLGSLGVDTATIVEDYALTQMSMDQVLARASADPARAAEIAEVPATFFSADPLGMERLLADIERQHVSVRNYVRWLGVDDAALRQLDALLLDG